MSGINTMPNDPGPEKKDPAKPEDQVAAAAKAALAAKVATRPVVINLGSASRKRIKKLKRGTGRLVDKVRSAVDLAAVNLGQDAEGQTLLPVVVVYKEKRRRRRGGPQGMCPLCCI
jgi:hypothetical protein